MKTEPNDPVNPVGHDIGSVYSGIVIREYFAARAMQGLLSMNREPDASAARSVLGPAIAEDAVFMADLLIKELNRIPAGLQPKG